jgi:AbrB family looped-hinge helix DNA binding protein
MALSYYDYSIDRELVMTAVTVSPKFQVVIPKDVRESMGIFSGQKIQVLTYKNRIELIPIKPMKKLKGFLKGIDTDVERNKDRV